MNILIAYASKHGSTKKCAEKLSEKLIGKVDLCNIKEEKAPDLAGYDKIIIGGSIYAGRIQKEISDFCIKNIGLLKDKKTGLFICCMVKGSEEAQIKTSFPEDLLSSAVVKESFGGEFRFKDMNFAEKVITKMVSKAISKKDKSMEISDMKEDVSNISEEKINKFARFMNNA